MQALEFLQVLVLEDLEVSILEDSLVSAGLLVDGSFVQVDFVLVVRYLLVLGLVDKDSLFGSSSVGVVAHLDLSLCVEQNVVEVVSDFTSVDHIADHVLQGVLVWLVIRQNVFFALQESHVQV